MNTPKKINLEHWKNPRSTIACQYEDNDYGYVFHATSILIDILEFSNLTVIDCKKIKALDYGCGTGRVTRQLALTGAHVEGYDPVKECIDESSNEANKLVGKYKSPKLFTSAIDDISSEFDLIFSVNVLEHLYESDFNTAIANMEKRLKEGGIILLWVHKTKNLDFIRERNIEMAETSTNIQVLVGKKTSGMIEYRHTRRS